jgi:hypothetical protein
LSATSSYANKKSFSKTKRIFNVKNKNGSSGRLQRRKDFEKKQRRKLTNN